jgi:hypothetical protein
MIEESTIDWQPIETAPRDGTEVLSCAVDYPEDISIVSFRLGRYGNTWVGMCDGVPAIEAQGDTFTEYHTPFVTHWMPLPEPPKGDNK